MAFVYSVRLRRCKTTEPGFGCMAALRSTSASNQSRNCSYFAREGRGMPGGGIMPARIFRITGSQISGWLPTELISAD